MITNKNIDYVLKTVRRMIPKDMTMAVPESADRDPFKILVATVISARTKDEVTHDVARRLFSKAGTPEQLAKMNVLEIERLIYPAGFYKVKARKLKELAKMLINRYGGRVPDTVEELVKLPGVGRKTANLVLVLGFDKPGICVDTHVHRIMNRWGYVHTKTPEETEYILRKKLPKKYWKTINHLLVTFGRSVCKPIKPRCDECLLNKICPYGTKMTKKRGIKTKNLA